MQKVLVQMVAALSLLPGAVSAHAVGIMKQGILFMAIAAAPRMNELRLDRREIEPHRKAEKRIETFEENLARMAGAQVAQHGKRGFSRSSIADTVKVRRQI